MPWITVCYHISDLSSNEGNKEDQKKLTSSVSWLQAYVRNLPKEKWPTEQPMPGLANKNNNCLRHNEWYPRLHKKDAKTVFDSGFHAVDPRFQFRLYFSLCQWNLNSEFQSLVGSVLLEPYSGWSPGFWIAQPKFSVSHYGFHNQKFPGFGNPVYLTCGK